MDHNYFQQGAAFICSHFTKPHPEKVIESIWPDVKDYPNFAINAASKRVQQDFHPGQLVPIGKIRDIIIQEGKKILETEAIEREKEDRMNRQSIPEALPRGHDEYSRACCDFLQKTFSGRYTKEQLRAIAEEGEKKFPGKGFDAWMSGSLRTGKVLPIERDGMKFKDAVRELCS